MRFTQVFLFNITVHIFGTISTSLNLRGKYFILNPTTFACEPFHNFEYIPCPLMIIRLLLTILFQKPRILPINGKHVIVSHKRCAHPMVCLHPVCPQHTWQTENWKRPFPWKRNKELVFKPCSLGYVTLKDYANLSNIFTEKKLFACFSDVKCTPNYRMTIIHLEISILNFRGKFFIFNSATFTWLFNYSKLLPVFTCPAIVVLLQIQQATKKQTSLSKIKIFFPISMSL